MIATLAQRRRLIGLSILFICLELLLVGFVDKPLSQFLRTVDTELPTFVNVFRFFTDLGKSFIYLWPSGIGMIVCLALARWPQITRPKRQKLQIIGQKLAFFFSCVAVSGIITDIFKPLIGRARPVMLMRDGYYGFDPLSTHFVHNSLPSGHATTAFAVAGALMVLWPKSCKAFLTFAILLSLSRLIVNAHFLADIFAGAAVGTLTVVGVTKIFRANGWLAARK